MPAETTNHGFIPLETSPQIIEATLLVGYKAQARVTAVEAAAFEDIVERVRPSYNRINTRGKSTTYSALSANAYEEIIPALRAIIGATESKTADDLVMIAETKRLLFSHLYSKISTVLINTTQTSFLLNLSALKAYLENSDQDPLTDLLQTILFHQKGQRFNCVASIEYSPEECKLGMDFVAVDGSRKHRQSHFGLQCNLNSESVNPYFALDIPNIRLKKGLEERFSYDLLPLERTELVYRMGIAALTLKNPSPPLTNTNH